VDLEIVVWSESRTELGIRPRCAYHRLRDTHRYFDAAHAVLDGLVDRLSR
jgi:hypothetical protein